MPYILNRPTGTELQSVSQSLIQGNFNAANTSFNVEHYAFADTTPENGLHNTVTQPQILGGVHPTTTTFPIIYAMNTGGASPPLLQWTRGTSNAVPTPLISIHSPATAITLNNATATTIFDFSKISGVSIATLYFWCIATGGSQRQYIEELIAWDSSGPYLTSTTIKQSISSLNVTIAGTIVGVSNATGTNLTNVYWTLRLHRAS